MDFYLKIVTNTSFLILILIIFTLAFHYFFLNVYKLNKIQLKKLEYIYLSAAFIGLIGYSSNLRIWLSSNQLYWYKNIAISSFNLLRDDVDTIYCPKFTRSDFSPENFDEIQIETDLVCEWFKKVAGIIPKTGDDLPEVKFEDLPFINVKEPILVSSIDRLKKMIYEYNIFREKYYELVKKSSKNSFEVILSFLSPMLICIAIAIRITKVSGELAIEKSCTAKSVDS
jgi:hypothetical protein